jgi:hypothetical protein
MSSDAKAKRDFVYHHLLPALQGPLSPSLLPELIGLTAEYARVMGADFDERVCTWARRGWKTSTDSHDIRPRHRHHRRRTAKPDGGAGPALSLATIDIQRCERFVWVVAKEPCARSGLARWSLRLDMAPDSRMGSEVSFGVSTMTVDQARFLSSYDTGAPAEEAAAASDRTGIWWNLSAAHWFRH